MKKALTIFVDDDCELEAFCGTIVERNTEGNTTLHMINQNLKNCRAIKLPFRGEAQFWASSQGGQEEPAHVEYTPEAMGYEK